MRILSINIDQFGMHTKYQLEFDQGINIIEGSNESGKSTIAAFIKFIFYGADKRQFSDNTLSERNKYLNWHTGTAAGSLTIEESGRVYRIRRELYLKSRTDNGREHFAETIQIVDLETNTPVYKNQVPGEIFFGVTQDIFESTAYIKQLENSNIRDKELGDAVENILFSADEKINTQKAAEKLDQARRALLHKNGRGGILYESKTDRSQIEKRYEKAKSTNIDIISKEAAISDLSRKATESKLRLAKLMQKNDSYDAVATLKRFDALNALQSKVTTKEKELKTFVNHNSFDGFFPNKEYVTSLREYQRNIIADDQDFSTAASSLTNFKFETVGDRRLNELYNKMNMAGGKESVIKEYNSQKASVSKAGFNITLMFIFCGITLIASSIMFLINIFAGAGLLITSIVLLIIGMSMIKNRKERISALENIKKAFGGNDEVVNEEFFERLYERCLENEKEQKEYREFIAKLEHELATKRTALTKLKDEAIELLEVYNIKTDYEGVVLALSDSADFIDRVIAEKINLEHELEKYKLALDNAREELKGFNEKELREKVENLNVAEIEQLNISTLRREIEFIQKGIDAINAKKIELEKQLITLEAVSEDPATLAEQLLDIDKRIDDLTKKHEAYVLASDSIDAASDNLRAGVTPRLSTFAKRMMSKITSGKYNTIGVDSDFELNFGRGDSLIPLDYLSAGTQDAAYISLRLALIDLLFRKSKPPIVFDESFAYQDNERTTQILNLLQYLTTTGYQCIIFTCHAREAQLYSEIGEFNHIYLD